MMKFVIALSLVALLVVVHNAQALDVAKLRLFAAKNNVSCIFVFGDSSVDPGNNNNLITDQKGNFLPYGKDFYNGRPTGRFTNGRLATDLIADALGHTKTIPAYLDPNLTNAQLVNGVSFASGGSGFDDLTAQLSNVIPLSKQLEYFREYKARLAKLVGKKRAENLITNGVFLLSMGTNDFLQNYYVEPTRSKQFTIDKYQHFLISSMSKYIQVQGDWQWWGWSPSVALHLLERLRAQPSVTIASTRWLLTLTRRLYPSWLPLNHLWGSETFTPTFTVLYGIQSTTRKNMVLWNHQRVVVDRD
uniref:GDSL esterase/lipase At5g45950-like isoform X2 n=1 Tax=Erigeron canadensis TaxID=72917 RepID=UPI001CB9B887|nr:GDSL esterase/lipase At5g45950-like isoform X2 [Erigeron canadensis]